MQADGNSKIHHFAPPYSSSKQITKLTLCQCVQLVYYTLLAGQIDAITIGILANNSIRATRRLAQIVSFAFLLNKVGERRILRPLST